ncbi:hypothetical protein EBQ93_03075 [bacterium]|nr:hypothetical protein [bacterium]
MKKFILSGLLALGLYTESFAKQVPAHTMPAHDVYNIIVPTLVSMYATWGVPSKTWEDVIASSVCSTLFSQVSTAAGEWFFAPRKSSIVSQTGRCAAKCPENMIIKSCGFGAKYLAQGLKTDSTEPSFIIDTAIPFVVEIAVGSVVSGSVKSAFNAWFAPVDSTKTYVDVSYLKSRGYRLGKQGKACRARNQEMQAAQAKQLGAAPKGPVHTPERLMERA